MVIELYLGSANGDEGTFIVFFDYKIVSTYNFISSNTKLVVLELHKLNGFTP